MPLDRASVPIRLSLVRIWAFEAFGGCQSFQSSWKRPEPPMLLEVTESLCEGGLEKLCCEHKRNVCKFSLWESPKGSSMAWELLPKKHQKGSEMGEEAQEWSGGSPKTRRNGQGEAQKPKMEEPKKPRNGSGGAQKRLRNGLGEGPERAQGSKMVWGAQKGSKRSGRSKLRNGLKKAQGAV